MKTTTQRATLLALEFASNAEGEVERATLLPFAEACGTGRNIATEPFANPAMGQALGETLLDATEHTVLAELGDGPFEVGAIRVVSCSSLQHTTDDWANWECEFEFELIDHEEF